MKVSEAIDQVQVGDTVWVKGKVNDTDKSDQPLYVCIGDAGYNRLGNSEEISLTEPQADKVEVPDFVAEWYESNKYKLERAIIDVACSMEKGEFPYNLPFEDWFIDPENHPIETLISMMKDGYTVKPKRWVVSFQKHGTTFFFSHWDSISSFVPVGCSTVTNDCIARFTDKEKACALANLIGGSVVPLEFRHE